MISGLATAAVVFAVQMVAVRLRGLEISSGYLLAHLLAVGGVYVGLAAALDSLDRRWWASVAFAAPVVLALIPDDLASWSARLVLAVAVGAGIVGCGAWRRFGARPAVPWVAGGCGALLANGVLLIRAGGAASRSAWPGLLALAVLGTGLAIVGAWLGPWIPRAGALERRQNAMIVACGLVVAIGTLFVPSLRGSALDADVPVSGGGAADGAAPVVVIVLDTVRADHLGTYGAPGDPTPAIDRFATREATVVERAVAQSPWSLPSHASLFTGRFPPNHGAHGPLPADPDPARAYAMREHVPTLAGLLAEAGYLTVGISGNAGMLAPRFGIAAGFDVYRVLSPAGHFRRTATPWSRLLQVLQLAPVRALRRLRSDLVGVPYRRASAVADAAIEWVDRVDDRPFLLFANFVDAHYPYRPPSDWLDGCPGVRDGHHLAGIGTRRREAVIQGRDELDVEELGHLRAMYGCEVRYVDRHVGRLLERLRQHPKWDRMWLVVTSDHGEALGEHGRLGHGSQLHDEQVRVPLILKTPPESPVAPGSRLRGPWQLVDILPSILDGLGIQSPDGIDGRAWGTGDGTVRAWLFGQDRLLRAVEQRRLKLIEALGRRYWLFDLNRDPAEDHDLASSHVQERRRLSRLLGNPPRYTGRERDPEPASESRDLLRALGYVR